MVSSNPSSKEVVSNATEGITLSDGRVILHYDGKIYLITMREISIEEVPKVE